MLGFTSRLKRRRRLVALALLLFACLLLSHVGQSSAYWGGSNNSGNSGSKQSKDYYEILGVPRDADERVIKKQFRNLAMYVPFPNSNCRVFFFIASLLTTTERLLSPALSKPAGTDVAFSVLLSFSFRPPNTHTLSLSFVYAFVFVLQEVPPG